MLHVTSFATRHGWYCLALAGCCGWIVSSAVADELLVPKKSANSLRIATYNVSLNRSTAGELAEDLQSDHEQAWAIASVIRIVQPDVLLLNEVDYSTSEDNAALFESRYLANAEIDALGGAAWPLPHQFTAPVNTGEPSGMDLNSNRRVDDPEDAWGYGKFPGQYGMAVLSRFEIATDRARTLQRLPWSALPDAQQPLDPDTNMPYYAPEIWSKLRLSSKSFWDVPIVTPLGELHVIASHPTPPAFDGPEDRNGARNHDEIKLIQHYIEAAPFLRDDRGVAGGLADDDLFVVVGDLNSDPHDGGSRPAAIRDLLQHPRVAKYPAPRSLGAALASQSQGRMNAEHVGPAAEDTGDFNDRSVGNLRIDYVLPSHQLEVIASGVFWPAPEHVPAELREAVTRAMSATDHHLVWVDVRR